MGKYILKRLVYIVIVFFIVSLLMYALYNLIPGDPAMVEMEPLRKVLKPAEWQRQYLENEPNWDWMIRLSFAMPVGWA